MRQYSIIRKIKVRRFSSYMSLVILLTFFGMASLTNMLGETQKSRASTVILERGESIEWWDSSLDGNDIIIRNSSYWAGVGGIATEIYAPSRIDGGHTFKSLTVEPNGVLTTSNYGSTLPFNRIEVTGTFNIQTGGKLNLNGRGYGLSQGPGASYVFDGVNTTGASHSGVGGASRDNRYDYDEATPPGQPGSGSLWASTADSEWADQRDNNYGYGGGYIHILATTINLEAGSRISANGIGGNVRHPRGGASGGAIVLEDSDSGSRYDGTILALGAGCRERAAGSEGAGHCYSGGGGGGYIYIKTATSASVLSARRSYDLAGNWYNAIDMFKDTLSATSAPGWPYSSADIAVSGGSTERGESGAQGILTVVGTGVRMKKTLEPVVPGRGGSLDFNPYALQVGDNIKVVLDLRNLPVGENVWIEDGYLINPDGTGGRCKYQGELSATTGVAEYRGGDSSSVAIISIRTDIGYSSISYKCTVE